jgi:transcriptional repressor NrdR
VDTRSSGEGFVVRRRRVCSRCRRRYTTYERLEQTALFVCKRDGRREPFDPAKLRGSLLTACKKRGIAREKIEEIVGDIESAVVQNHEREVPSRFIGDRVIEALRKIDPVAYMRFLSVYREFKGPQEFVAEARALLR